jgi:proline dehydrogenase
MIPPLAGRFVAGESAATALEHTRQLNDDDVGGILNLLGEHYHERAPAAADADAYCQLVADAADTDLRVCLSVKPTQLGLLVGEDAFRQLLARVVECAHDNGVFVWIDMEDHTTTDATLDAFEYHAREHGNVGVCVQANLRRTGDDLRRLADLPGKVRLVKGAYDPPLEVAIQEAAHVDEAFERHLAYMFEHFEDGIAVGSHDPAMLAQAATLHQEYATPYEVQMLMGVRGRAQRDLAGRQDVWQYVPYGSKWLSYFYRRVTENVDNATFAIRALRPG